MAEKITVDEWIAEIEKLSQEPNTTDGFTSTELSAALGYGGDKVRKILVALLTRGKIAPTVIRRTSVLDNITRPVRGYALVKAKKGRAA